MKLKSQNLTFFLAAIFFGLSLLFASQAYAATEFISIVDTGGTGDYSNISTWEAAFGTIDLTSSATKVYSGTPTLAIADTVDTIYLCHLGAYQNTTANPVHETSTQLLVKTISGSYTPVSGDIWYTNSTCNSSNYFTLSGAQAAGDSAIAVAKCRATTSAADTSAVTLSGWTTSAANYIDIYADTGHRHSGVWDDTKYRLEGSTNPMVSIAGADNVKFHDIQVNQTSTTGGGMTVGTPGTSAVVEIYRNIVKTAADNTTYGIRINSPSGGFDGIAKIYNNIVYDLSGANGDGIIQNGVVTSANIYVYNNTTYNCYNNFRAVSGSISTIYYKNNLAQKCVSACYVNMGEVVTKTTNLSEDDTSPNNTWDNKIVSFDDGENEDFHLSPLDTSAREQGTDCSTDADWPNPDFTDDVDGETRPGGSAWDIGADEVFGSYQGLSGYRWFANANSTNVGTALAAQDTVAAAPPRGTPFRLRALLHDYNEQLDTSDNQNFKLQYSERSGTCDVPVYFEGFIETSASASYYAQSIAVDGNALYVAGVETGINWRIEKRDLATGSPCDNSPSSECGGAGTFGTAGVVTGASASEVAQSIAVDGNALYVAGYDASPDWRIEKRDLATGSPCDNSPSSECGGAGTFGTAGVVTGDSASHQAFSLAVDGNALYVAGYDESPDWRIEKRDLATGSPCDNSPSSECGGAGTFGTAGVVTGDSASHQAFSIAVDGNALYVAGYDASPDWRIEKRDLATGSPCDNSPSSECGGAGTFGTAGVVTGASASEVAQSIAVDGNALYVAGYDASPDWRIEKRDLATGSPCDNSPSSECGGAGTFGTAGVVTGASESYIAYSIAVDGNALYVAGVDASDWRIEKRDLATGSPCDNSPSSECGGAGTFGTAGVVTGASASDYAYSLAVDGNALYVAGFNASSNWRIEKRSIYNGDFVFTYGGFEGENWNDVSASSGAIRFYDNSVPADGADLTDNVGELVHGSDDIVYETYEEANNFSISSRGGPPSPNIPVGDDGKWDFSLVNNSANANSAYCFRIVKSNDDLLADYDILPEILTATDFLMKGNFDLKGNFDFK